MFSVSVPQVDEILRPGETADQYVRRLAETKARAAAASAHPEHVIVAADTAVVDGEAILGKPKDMAEAEMMLRQLRGHVHQVYSGIAVLRMHDRRLVSDLCVTNVPMRAYGDDEARTYVLSGDPLDKAGAYAIQHPFFQPVESMSGCYASVMGLPLCHLLRAFRQLEITPSVDVPSNCQTFLRYQCPVSRAILRGEQAG